MSGKKVISVLSKVLTALILIFTLFVVIFTVVTVTTVGDGEVSERSLFGYKAYIVRSDSMHEQFAAGDIIFVRQTEEVSDLEPGTIITFYSIDPDLFGETVTHMIRGTTEYNGEAAYITYGTTTGNDDLYPVPLSQIVGVYQFHFPKLGYFFEFLRTPLGYVLVILLPFLLLIGLNFTHLIKLIATYNKEKKKQAAEVQAAAEADRAEAQRLREEMEQLKAQMETLKASSSMDSGQDAKKEESK